MFSLQKYNGKTTRFTCPGCNRHHSFTRYINTSTKQQLHPSVGICNRIIKCGYHYTPKQFFRDYPTHLRSQYASNQKIEQQFSKPNAKQTNLEIGEIPISYLQRSLSLNSHFVTFLRTFLSEDQMLSVAHKYALGATKNKEVIFWQIDREAKVRTGKIMQYNPNTGRRLKNQTGAINWVHNKLKKSNALTSDFNLQQCFFGEHLLTIYPKATVAIVESEKSAIIAAAFVPDIIWLAAGNINGLSLEKCLGMTGRNVILFPDLGAFEKWSVKAVELPKQFGCKVSISTLLEDKATNLQRANGLDIADFIFSELKSKEKKY